MKPLEIIKKFSSPKMLMLADQVLVSGASFATNILLARSLGLSEYGKFSGIILLQMFILSIQQASITGIFQVMFPGFDQKLKSSYSASLFFAELIFLSGLSLIALAAILAFPSFFQTYQSVIIPALLSVILFLLQDYLRKIFLTKEQPAKALWIDAITNILQMMVLALFSIFGKLDLALACWIVALTFIPSVIAGIIWLNPGKPVLSEIKTTAKLHKAKSGWLLLSALLQWGSGNFFVVAAGWWLGSAALGALRLAQYIYGLLNVLLQAIENYTVPKAASVHADGKDLGAYLKIVFKKSFLYIAPLLLLLSVFAKQVLQLAGGAAYTQYSYIMYALAFIYLLILTGNPFRVALRVHFMNKYYFTGYLIAAGFSICTARWMILTWNLNGVLAGLFLTQLILVCYWAIILTRKNIIAWKLFTSF